MASESQAGRHLYENLVAPAAALVPRDSRVVLVPDGALHWLNFETLPVYSTLPGVQPHYWIEDVRLVVAPSLAVLATSKQSIPLAPNSLLLIGDPVSPSPEFPPLSYASQEIARIRQHFPGSSQDTFVGPQARPASYQESQPGRFDLLHFSAHGVANQQSPLDSAIILSRDGDNFKLYARNIIPIHLRADLVTISACRSAGARSYSGEGLVGFVWAFLQAGARSVIAGLWDVTDSSTPGMMDVLYALIKDGHRPADSLREAKLELIRSTGSYRKPYYWGPFQLYTR
jgi:CHAT domain-containing protein